jgi:hypothetical protein
MTPINSLSCGMKHLLRHDRKCHHYPRADPWIFDLGTPAHTVDQMACHPKSEAFVLLSICGRGTRLVKEGSHIFGKTWPLVGDLYPKGVARARCCYSNGSADGRSRASIQQKV